MGTSNFTSISFDLASFFNPPPDLSSLVESFARTEIDAVVKALPSNKAPKPDGFNVDFIKKYWPIIIQISIDFVMLCVLSRFSSKA